MAAETWSGARGADGAGGVLKPPVRIPHEVPLPRLMRFPGVYPPQADTWLLARSVLSHEGVAGRRVLDVCTGTGALALAAVAAGARDVTAVDLSRRAVANARTNALLNRARVRVRRGDLFAPVSGGSFDAVVCNPPYVPSATARLARYAIDRSWDAGPDGRVLIDRVCAEAGRVLAPGGVLLLVQTAVVGVDRTLDGLAAAGLEPSVVARKTIGFGPVMRRRAALLVERGMIRPGQEHEEVVVVRGRARR